MLEIVHYIPLNIIEVLLALEIRPVYPTEYHRDIACVRDTSSISSCI